MEEDRLSSLEKLMNERERVKNLSLQIDKLAFERLQWLPNAVQQGLFNFQFYRCTMNILYFDLSNQQFYALLGSEYLFWVHLNLWHNIEILQ